MANKPQYLTGDKKAIRAFIDKFDIFLFDCDGVLWSGDTLFQGTVETLDLLRRGTSSSSSNDNDGNPGKQKQIVFVTNNSTKSREDYRKKLTSMGIPASVEEVFGSSYSAAIYISRILPKTHPHLFTAPANSTNTTNDQEAPFKPKVFVLGESGIESELASEGLTYICGSDPSYRRDITPQDYTAIAASDTTLIDPDVRIVLAGLDFHINYLKLALAFHYVKYHGALFLATNTDSTLPNSHSLFPGAGAISAPLITMLGGYSGTTTAEEGKNRPIALGKPSQAMMAAIKGKFEFDPSRTCMVGDRADTDIRFGNEGGLAGTLGVLTGVSSREEFEGGEVGARPKYVVDKLSDLLLGAED